MGFSMVIGIGNDIIDIRRIEKVLDRHGQRFIRRIFTSTEREKSETGKKRAASYAKRFAAKEACAKALGTGITAAVWWRDLGVINLPSGKPGMELVGHARMLIECLLPTGHEAIIHLTITDDYPWAQALVVIEALPVDRKQKTLV
ncbi:MAG: holo-[acyl-carrier protein] synthase [Candidatus Tokpelaia sp. JSC189]|nr:MAG: holo-[acyl-carrier protein] synthase [Candidatus Tokpelaia sp. JSC189]